MVIDEGRIASLQLQQAMPWDDYYRPLRFPICCLYRLHNPSTYSRLPSKAPLVLPVLVKTAKIKIEESCFTTLLFSVDA